MKIVIVGGGIIGLAASILLRQNDHEVTIIEKNNSLGGLLNSIQMDDGTYVDYGSHVPRETGIKKLDGILFQKLSFNQWNEYEYANVGNYFNGNLNKESQSIDVTNLESSIYIKGLQDILQTNLLENEHDERESLVSHFGETFANTVYEPLIKKLFGVDNIALLKPSSHLLFGFSRIILANQIMTEKFKELPYLDNRIAHVSNSIGASSKKNYYPKASGIYKWVENLHKQALDAGVKLHLNNSIINKSEKELTLQNNISLNYDKVIWTLPKAMLGQLLQIDDVMEAPKFRSVSLVHYKYKGKLLTENHYVYCNDATKQAFRVTLYENLTSTKNSWCTVEVIGQEVVNKDKLFKELIEMNILDSTSEMVTFSENYIKNGFPIPYLSNIDPKFEVSSDIILLNKDANNFFMEDLLIKMFNRLTDENLI